MPRRGEIAFINQFVRSLRERRARLYAHTLQTTRGRLSAPHPRSTNSIPDIKAPTEIIRTCGGSNGGRVSARGARLHRFIHFGSPTVSVSICSHDADPCRTRRSRKERKMELFRSVRFQKRETYVAEFASSGAKCVLPKSEKRFPRPANEK